MLDHPQAGHVFQMLVIAVRKRMPASAISHKVELLRARRVGGGLDGRTAGIGDRTGRQPIDQIGVVRRRLRNIALREGSTQRSFAENKPVDDGRIRLQLHLLLEPVREHGCNPRTFFRFTGFLFYDRREYDKLVRGLERQIRMTPLPDLPQQPILRLPHTLDHLLTGEAPIEIVAVGQKTALSRNLFHVPGKDLVIQKTRYDLLGSKAFRNGDLVLHHFALGDCLDDITQAGMRGEEILPSLEVRSCIEREHAAEKDQPMVLDDPFLGEQISDVHYAGAGRDRDDLVLRQRSRGLQPALAHDDCPTPDDQNQDEKGHKGIADDDHRATRPPGRPHGTGTTPSTARLQGRTRAARRDALWLHAGSTSSVEPAITGCGSRSRAPGRATPLTAFAPGLAAPLRSNKWSV